ncbi:type II toxin-antitoxin system RelB/DinJ family antitoxin [Enterococcus faecium]|uniref:type II toxin-antitoxin system RelB/DinJ family antitoxin n=1 Tax=Enterococcus faecium TaxID=1352 RepID=UPI000CF100FD|nr:type II toxin-antitoxin system RelB/DinJ family antitoxin [Enterococcus faecium]EGP4892465.1 type II toxin-antitoxin system RelB/DinJ family antitoxin [Enterococcus faecium]EGP4915345.1 type II toxin-antitoxin system RelB/DinJ family antitoxin [Enterococcus faecium]EGP4917858.1 type II toxin-antitoxin system RelB/DinJ family antitoxin [Enterococcus faecium]EGP5338780.1 type II toxin-antitoxin system RelB/DinJ family antitoxin [Enterococcus faecium]EGP5559832.1 type II toxin-antitoxin system
MSRLNIRIDDELKEQAREVYEEIGMDLSTAVIVFLKQSVRERKLPFQPGNEPREDMIARYEAENGITTKVSSVDELMEKLNADD